MRTRTVAVFVAVALLILTAGSLQASASGAASGASASAKLRGDLAAFVSGEQRLDPRIPKLVDGVRRFIEVGEEARFVEELPLKLVIIDETIVMFGMEDPVAGEADLTIVVVEHPQLASVLKIAFDAVWQRGLTFEDAAARHSVPEAKSA